MNSDEAFVRQATAEVLPPQSLHAKDARPLSSAEMPVPALPLILLPSRMKFGLLAAFSAAVTGCGVLMIRGGSAAGWPAALFFALCTVVFAVNLLPGACYLHLGETGFTRVTTFRSRLVRWIDVAEFFVTHLPAGTLVAWNLRDSARPTHSQRNWNRELSGCDAALPNSYGMQPEDLALLLSLLALHFAGTASGTVRGEALLKEQDQPDRA